MCWRCIASHGWLDERRRRCSTGCLVDDVVDRNGTAVARHDQQGGGMYLYSSTATISGTSFTSCTADVSHCCLPLSTAATSTRQSRTSCCASTSPPVHETPVHTSDSYHLSAASLPLPYVWNTLHRPVTPPRTRWHQGSQQTIALRLTIIYLPSPES